MGVGRNLHDETLKRIASEPTANHVFYINKFKGTQTIVFNISFLLTWAFLVSVV